MRISIIVIIVFTISIAKSYSLDHDKIDELNFDLLRAPSNPAFTLMDMGSTQIETPQDPGALLASIRQATNYFTKFPDSYSITLSPYWLFNWSKNTKWDNYSKGYFDNIFNNIIQNSTLSFGTTVDTNNSRILGIGLKISLIRGNIDNEKVKKIQDILDDQELNRIIRKKRVLTKDSQSLISEIFIAVTFI